MYDGIREGVERSRGDKQNRRIPEGAGTARLRSCIGRTAVVKTHRREIATDNMAEQNGLRLAMPCALAEEGSPEWELNSRPVKPPICGQHYRLSPFLVPVDRKIDG